MRNDLKTPELKGSVIANGYVEIGGLLALDKDCRNPDKIRIILGSEVIERIRTVVDVVIKAMSERIRDSIDEEAEKRVIRHMRVIIITLKTMWPILKICD